jgi:hypothetical protein
MALGAGDVPQAADETAQTVLGTALLGTQVITIYDNAADESQAAYNEIVPPQYQPLADPITTNYLGQARP